MKRFFSSLDQGVMSRLVTPFRWWLAVGILFLPLALSPAFAVDSQTANASLSSGYSPDQEDKIYLPQVMVYYPRVPFTPLLNAIANPEGGSYSLSWTESPRQLALTYTVQEATDSIFTQNVRQACSTPDLSCIISGQLAGDYFYRVAGNNDFGRSNWSNTASAAVLLPETPILDPIDGSDGSNKYSLVWSASLRATNYVLWESLEPDFADPAIVYSGAATSWTTPNPGSSPDTYYYKVKSTGPTGESAWSAPQSITIYPLFVNLATQWDGDEYIHTDSDVHVGTHLTRVVDVLADDVTVRSLGHLWYDPNPQNWPEENWQSLYTLSTGEFIVRIPPDDPAWKWRTPWFLPYDSQLYDGQIFNLNGKSFLVTGPYSAIIFGRPVQYWQLVNQNKFLCWDDGQGWRQYYHAGDILLWYDAGNTKLLFYEETTRRYYFQGQLTTYYVHYINTLDYVNALPDTLAGELEDAASSQATPK
jgi:hypothetical protein